MLIRARKLKHIFYHIWKINKEISKFWWYWNWNTIIKIFWFFLMQILIICWYLTRFLLVKRVWNTLLVTKMIKKLNHYVWCLQKWAYIQNVLMNINVFCIYAHLYMYTYNLRINMCFVTELTRCDSWLTNVEFSRLNSLLSWAFSQQDKNKNQWNYQWIYDI